MFNGFNDYSGVSILVPDSSVTKFGLTLSHRPVSGLYLLKLKPSLKFVSRSTRATEVAKGSFNPFLASHKRRVPPSFVGTYGALDIASKGLYVLTSSDDVVSPKTSPFS